MKDVVFVEDVKTVPIGMISFAAINKISILFKNQSLCKIIYFIILIGKVIKVDGCYVAVKFFSRDSKEKEIKEKDFSPSDFKDFTAEEPMKLLADCRLLRKDELQVMLIPILFICICNVYLNI